MRDLLVYHPMVRATSSVRVPEDFIFGCGLRVDALETGNAFREVMDFHSPRDLARRPPRTYVSFSWYPFFSVLNLVWERHS